MISSKVQPPEAGREDLGPAVDSCNQETASPCCLWRPAPLYLRAEGCAVLCANVKTLAYFLIWERAGHSDKTSR